MSHTPGPWTVCEHVGLDPWHREVRAADLSLIATVGNSNPYYPTVSNARLIAQAPAMLTLLQAIAAVSSDAPEHYVQGWAREARAILRAIWGEL